MSPISAELSKKEIQPQNTKGFVGNFSYQKIEKSSLSEKVFLAEDAIEKYKKLRRKDLLKKVSQNYLDFKQREAEEFLSLERLRSRESSLEKRKEESLSPKIEKPKEKLKRKPNNFPRKDFLKNFYESHNHEIVALDLMAKIRKQIEVEVFESVKRNRNKTTEAIEQLRKVVIPMQSKKFLSKGSKLIQRETIDFKSKQFWSRKRKDSTRTC